MKRLLIMCLLFHLIGCMVQAQQLTKADLQSIDAKLTKLTDVVTDMDKRLVSLETKVGEMDKRLTTQITEVDKRLTNQIAALDSYVRWAIGTLILVVLAVIVVPQILGYLRDKREREDLQKRVEQLEYELADLKARRIVS